MNLYELPIHVLHEMRIKGEITTQEIVHSVLQRMEQVEDKIQSFLYIAGESIIKKAKEVDLKIQQNKQVPALSGMPIAVKDMISIKGIPVTCGSKILKGYISPYESTVTQKLENVDYICVGKTNLDEFAMGSSTENSAFQVTKNPWNLEYVPGGSSGGSASAVSAGQALASIGTDTGGSIRQPASFTSIVGIKPTYGRVSRYGIAAYASSFDQAGPMTQDVQDAALLLETICGYDPKDATSLKTDVPPFQSFLGKSIQGMKIGIIQELDLADCDSDVIHTFEENVKLLQENGAEIVPISIPNLKHAIAAYYILAPSEASSNLGRYDGIRYGMRSQKAQKLLDVYQQTRDEGFGDEVKLRILIGTFSLSSGYYDAYYLKAQKIQHLIRKQFEKAFKTVDAIATPVAPTPAFKIGQNIKDPLQMYLKDAFTIPANLAGIPGISVPSGFSSENLPIGLQLLGKSLDEGTLLQIAHFFETHLNLQKPSQAL